MNEALESAWIDFTARRLRDLAKGTRLEVEQYLALYPGLETAIKEEFESASKGEHPRGPGDPTAVGPYILERVLGRGGQGTVWSARDERVDRRVALKLVPRSPLFEDLAPRLRREAELVSRLDHPGICTIYDVGAEDAVTWLAMQYVDGVTLREKIANHPNSPPDPLEVVATIEKVARILHAAHEVGIIHRDVKPGNVMIRPDGTPVVLDFGVATHSEDGPPLTLSGDAIGTPAYMAPEQLTGNGRVDARADVWGLGILLRELMTHRRPFDGPSHQGLLRSILEDDVPRLSDQIKTAPRDLQVVIETALQKDPHHRYRNALTLAEDLRRIGAGEAIAARRATSLERLSRWRRRNRALAATLALLFLVFASASVVTVLLLRRTRSTLAEVTRLSDQRIIDELLLEFDSPRPLTPANAPALDRWIRRTEAVLAGADEHRRTLATVEARVLAAPPESRREGRLGRPDDVWIRDQLDQLMDGLSQLEARIERGRQRLAFALDVERATIEEHRAAWDRTAAAIAADPRFGGFRLTPQRGLIPLGEDAASGLQEFAHLQSGRPPERDSDTGHLVLTEDSGIVLVLLPGARTTVGSTPPDLDSKDPSPYSDSMAGPWEHPLQHVLLDPYFIGKYELTQAQWQRHTGENPSGYQGTDEWIDPSRPLLHPVELVSQEDCVRLLAQMELELPTEVQWEYAARAGTATRWWTGDEIASLRGAGNLADRYAKDHEGGANWEYELSLDDGAVGHVPVGSYAANPFGLHDVIGNCGEWCRDTWESWSDSSPRDGDGFVAPIDGSTVVMRGGAYSSGVRFCRSAHRDGYLPDTRMYYVGARAARHVMP